MHLRFPSRLRPIVAVVAIWMLACGCGPGAADAGSDAQGDAAPIDEGATPPGEGAPPTTAGTAVGGAEALGGPRITSLDDLASWIQASTGSCADAAAEDSSIPDTLDDIYEDPEDEAFLRDITPLVAAAGRCTVDEPDGSTLSVKMVLFEEGSFTDVQRIWKTHTTGRPPDSWALFGTATPCTASRTGPPPLRRWA